MSISDLAYAGLEQAINQHIASDPGARGQMAQLHGRIIAIEILGPGQTIFLVPGPELTQLLASYEGEPDCTLHASPLTLAQLRRPMAEGEVAVPADMRVSGDAELAQEFCAILRRIQVDWEAYLTPYTGSLIAGELGKAIDFAAYWRDHIIDTLNREVRDFVQQDSGMLPERHEIAAFGNGVLQVEQRVEQLAARIEKLQEQRGTRR
jgi:ubiquinone biosynthesis accessory factor UbiJ